MERALSGVKPKGPQRPRPPLVGGRMAQYCLSGEIIIKWRKKKKDSICLKNKKFLEPHPFENPLHAPNYPPFSVKCHVIAPLRSSLPLP